MNDKRVLLAGPTGGALRGAAGILERAGFDVALVDAPEILETYEAGPPPELLIIDEAFGPEGGVSVCRTLRTNNFWRPVSLMLVVPAGEQHLEECLVAGINDFILAPFPADELVDKVRRLTVIPARRELNTLVRVREAKQDGGTLLGKTLNVSKGGLLVEVESLLALGRNVDLEFFLPEDPDVLRAKGRVIRRATELDLFHPAFGIRFLEMRDKDRDRIDRFVAERESGEARARVLPDEGE